MWILDNLRNDCCAATVLASGALALTSAAAATFSTVATVWHGGRCFASAITNSNDTSQIGNLGRMGLNLSEGASISKVEATESLADSCDVVPILIVGGLISGVVLLAAYKIMQASRNAMAPAHHAQSHDHNE